MKKHLTLLYSGFVFLMSLLVLLCSSCGQSKSIRISSENGSDQVAFAINEIQAALDAKHPKFDGDILIRTDPKSEGLMPEGFRISVDGNTVTIVGADDAGTMYGGLELAEQLRIYGLDEIQEMVKNSYLKRRGTKFNIPLDVRTPSYTDPCDAAQKNIAEMWNFDFWKEYIDDMARYRYNFITLWSLHPFPSMVKVPGYEDVTLADVQRSTVNWKEYYSGNGVGFDAPEILGNTEVLKEMTIDQKIDFWRRVMAYGKSRNVKFYVVTWNIFVNGTGGKYGITDEIDNPVTKDYFRKSVKQMFVTYPDLVGIGLTTGENMPKSTSAEKEEWAFETYAQGVMDAVKEFPDRKITFIHRQHQTGAREIADQFKPLLSNKNIDFIFSYKYAQAHVMSATKQTFHQAFVEDIGKEGLKTIWTLRNDDDYLYRWGAPAFVREFIQNIPYDVSDGYYYGSDQWIWGREFTMQDEVAESPRQLEVKKHWYHWMMWGRLGYDPTIDDSRFVSILQDRYPEVDARELFNAWQAASMVYPVTTGFHWGPLDFQWYIEACKSRPGYAQNETGFHDVNRFINLPPHPNSGYQSIPDFVEAGNLDSLESPLKVAEKLHSLANEALIYVASAEAISNKELKVTLHDIKTMALLGDYYGYKIAGATKLAFFRETNDVRYQAEAVDELEKALEAWTKYTAASLEQNINPIWTNRVGYVDWEKLAKWAADDILIAKGVMSNPE